MGIFSYSSRTGEGQTSLDFAVFSCKQEHSQTNCPIPPPIVSGERPFNKALCHSNWNVLVPCNHLDGEAYLSSTRIPIEDNSRLNLERHSRRGYHHSSPCSHFQIRFVSHRSQVRIHRVVCHLQALHQSRSKRLRNSLAMAFSHLFWVKSG